MSENGSSERYDVVLLVEQALTAQDAAQVRSLHEGLDEPAGYDLTRILSTEPGGER